MLWQDVDAVGASPRDAPTTAAAADRDASGSPPLEENFSIASLAREAAENNADNAAAAAAVSVYLPDAVPRRRQDGVGSSATHAPGAGGAERHGLVRARAPEEDYISDELMYRLYDGDGNGHGKIRLRRRRHRNEPWNLDRHGSPRTDQASSGGNNNNNNNGSDDDSDGTPAPQQRNLVWRYLSCLWPPETEEEKARLDQSAWAQNWFLRLLLKERWTDGSLISLKTDIFSGVTLAVAQVAPSIAFALMARGPPLVGLFSSFWLGIIPCIFGGRPGQITAIAGAVVVLYPDLVTEHGVEAAYAVCMIAGCFILIPGILRVAGLVRLLPASLMLGFCNGLGISMVIHQIPSFKDEQGNYVTGLRAFYTAIICVVSYAVMMLMPYFTNVIPSAFVAIVIGTLIQYIFQLKTVTIGDLYELHGTFPKPMIPNIDWSDSSVVSPVMVAAILTAIISCVESFMSDYKIQQLTETPTNFEREAITLGVAHIVNGFFQGMAGCVVFGPCILNIECGSGTRRLSGFICAVLMVIIPIALFAVIRIIPMAALSAVLFGVSSKTADWRMLAMIFLQRISFQESIVALVVTIVTVVQNLAIGAASGLAAALVFFMWNMSRGKIYITPVLSPDGVVSANANANGDAQADVQAAGEAPTSALQREDSRVHHHDTASDEPISATTPHKDGTSAAPAVVAAVVTPSAPHPLPRPERRPRLAPQQQRFMEVNLLNVEVDPVFSEIKVLRIHLRGVLFFGSCMEFVDSMIKLLRDCHEHIFLKVTDIILDFQHGRMPVMDFSAAEAIFDSANTLARRGIRTHVQNMDPLSYALFERCRRYFPLVLDDNVNNCKQKCFFRRVFQLQSTHETSRVAAEVNSAAVAAAAADPARHGAFADGEGHVGNTSFVTRSGNFNDINDASRHTPAIAGEGDHLQDDVFLRANRSFTRSFAEVAITRRAHPHHPHHHHNDHGHHFDPIPMAGNPGDAEKDGVELGVVATSMTADMLTYRNAVSGSDADDDDDDGGGHDERKQAAREHKQQQQEEEEQQQQVRVSGDAEADNKSPHDGDPVEIVVTAPDRPPSPSRDATTAAPAAPPYDPGHLGIPPHPPVFESVKLPCSASGESLADTSMHTEDGDEVVVLRLVAIEEQLALEASIKVGFPIFRPHFGITVPVYATIDGWVDRLTREEKVYNARLDRQKRREERAKQTTASGTPAPDQEDDDDQADEEDDDHDDVVHELDRAVDANRKPFNRQYGDFFTKVWWRRLFKLDIPPTASEADKNKLIQMSGQTAAEARATAIRVQDQPPQTASISSEPAFSLRVRKAPTDFSQVPRFPGQGYAKHEVLHRAEFARMKKLVCRRIFHNEAPDELACFPARMKKFEVDLMDGFI